MEVLEGDGELSSMIARVGSDVHSRKEMSCNGKWRLAIEEERDAFAIEIVLSVVSGVVCRHASGLACRVGRCGRS